MTSLGNTVHLGNAISLGNQVHLGNTISLTLGNIDDIGIPGNAGFGVGIASILPPNMAALSGTTDKTSDNYGNYIHAPTGGIYCYVPRYVYKIGTGANGIAVNQVDIKPASAYASTAAANADGYALHRAFIDGGVEQPGCFVGKYMGSQVAMGTGQVVTSVKNGLPISTALAHNPISALTACATDNYYQTINACHAIDGVDGAVNPSSIYFPTSRFIHAALALLSQAHGQASTSVTNCAYYHATYNFPKGCNNNALSDVNDTTVKWESDGYSNCGKTGSAGFGGGVGNEFAKSTHNGQNSGVADLNGLMYETNIGMMAVGGYPAISNATQASPCALTMTGHGLTTGDRIQPYSIVGMVELNDKIFTVTVVDANTVTLDGIDSTAYTAYTSGGNARTATFYAAKTSARMAEFTDGVSAATDHWGSTTAAANFDAISPAFIDNVGAGQRIGNAANQVLSEAVAGNDYTLAGLGLPAASSGISAGGTNEFGTDYYYQYLRDQLFPLSSFYWGYGSGAGVWALLWYSGRGDSSDTVGFRPACYPVN